MRPHTVRGDLVGRLDRPYNARSRPASSRVRVDKLLAPRTNRVGIRMGHRIVSPGPADVPNVEAANTIKIMPPGKLLALGFTCVLSVCVEMTCRMGAGRFHSNGLAAASGRRLRKGCGARKNLAGDLSPVIGRSADCPGTQCLRSRAMSTVLRARARGSGGAHTPAPLADVPRMLGARPDTAAGGQQPRTDPAKLRPRPLWPPL